MELIANVEVLILEFRYMDDYFALWRCIVDQPPSTCCLIESELRARTRQRYCLPLEDDEGDTFVGLLFACCLAS